MPHPYNDAMADLLLIDDDPDLIVEQVRQAFPGPPHRVEVAGTGTSWAATRPMAL